MKNTLTPSEVRSRTGWSETKVRRLIRNGKLPAINSSVGERPTYEIRTEDLERLLTPKTVEVERG